MSDGTASTDPRPAGPEPAAAEPIPAEPIPADPPATVDPPEVDPPEAAAPQGAEPLTVPAQSAPPAVEIPPSPSPAPSASAPAETQTGPAEVQTGPAEVQTGPAETRGMAMPTRKALIGVGVVVLAVVLLGAIGYAVWDRVYADPTRDAVAGHCLGGLPVVEAGEDREVTGARIVPCDGPDAGYLVEGRLDNVTEEQAHDREICRGYRHATDIYRAVPDGGTGYVLCLSRRAGE